MYKSNANFPHRFQYKYLEDRSFSETLIPKKKAQMSFFNSMFPVLFLFALFFPAKPDDALIRNLCGKTEQPVVCSDCLESDSSSQSADGRGLALIAIGCAERDTRLMAQRLYDLHRRTPDPTLKTLLSDCWLSVGYAAGDFPGMTRVVEAGDYAGGKNIVEIVVRNVNSCLDEFNRNPSVPVPSVVLAGTVAANQDCLIVVDILNNI